MHLCPISSQITNMNSHVVFMPEDTEWASEFRNFSPSREMRREINHEREASARTKLFIPAAINALYFPCPPLFKSHVLFNGHRPPSCAPFGNPIHSFK